MSLRKINKIFIPYKDFYHKSGFSSGNFKAGERYKVYVEINYWKDIIVFYNGKGYVNVDECEAIQLGEFIDEIIPEHSS